MRTILLKQQSTEQSTITHQTSNRCNEIYLGDDDISETVTDDWLYEQIITEDDTPVDNIPSSKQQRLLVDCLYHSGMALPKSPFLAEANVGIFYAPKMPAIVPDMFLSLGVQVAKDWWEKKNRSYFTSVFGKPPDVVIEIVSNLEGGEDSYKLPIYATVKVLYYVIFDPCNRLNKGELRCYRLKGSQYLPMTKNFLPKIGLGLTVWTGAYEEQEQTWLRWIDKSNNLLLTGSERADKTCLEKEQERFEKEQALNQLKKESLEKEKERQRADKAHFEKEKERQRADKAHFEKEQALNQLKQLRAQLQALGINPDELNQ